VTTPWFENAPSVPRGSRVVSHEVYETVLSAILRNEIPPAARINIEAVAQSLRVSATPVREALARLESEGLVEKVHLKGYRAAGLLTTLQLADLWDFRLLIEPFGAARAAEAADRPGVVDVLVNEMKSSSAAPFTSDFDSWKQFSAHDSRLHGLILDLSGNEVIARAFDRTHCHLHSLRLGAKGFARQETIDEHAAIVERIAASDAGGAAETMRAHLENSRDRLVALAPDA
jgi:DNA-binding GntR family transcriptional regulator